MFPANATFRTYRRRLENGFLFSMNFPHPLFFRYHRAETIDCQYAYAPEITSTTWQRTPYFQADRIPNYYVVALMAFLMEISPLRSFWTYLLARFPLFKVHCMHTLASLRPRRHFFLSWRRHHPNPNRQSTIIPSGIWLSAFLSSWHRVNWNQGIH